VAGTTGTAGPSFTYVNDAATYSGGPGGAFLAMHGNGQEPLVPARLFRPIGTAVWRQLATLVASDVSRHTAFRSRRKHAGGGFSAESEQPTASLTTLVLY